MQTKHHSCSYSASCFNQKYPLLVLLAPGPAPGLKSLTLAGIYAGTPVPAHLAAEHY